MGKFVRKLGFRRCLLACWLEEERASEKWEGMFGACLLFKLQSSALVGRVKGGSFSEWEPMEKFDDGNFWFWKKESRMRNLIGGKGKNISCLLNWAWGSTGIREEGNKIKKLGEGIIRIRIIKVIIIMLTNSIIMIPDASSSFTRTDIRIHHFNIPAFTEIGKYMEC